MSEDRVVADRVIKVFADFKKVPREEITMDTTFESLGLDSLDGLNLIFELEEEFDIMVPDNKVQEMKSVRQAVEGVETLLEMKERGEDPHAAVTEEFVAQQAKEREEVDAGSE